MVGENGQGEGGKEEGGRRKGEGGEGLDLDTKKTNYFPNMSASALCCCFFATNINKTIFQEGLKYYF